MRIYDERYTRDLRRYDLAMRLIRHKARTETISRLTGLAPAPIRRLYREYAAESGIRAQRLRGSAPKRIDYFFSSRSLQDEASAVANGCVMLGLIPNDLLQTQTIDEKALEQAEKLCDLFELYQFVTVTEESPHTAFSIEHLLLLVTTLSRGEKILLGNCERCGAYLIFESSATAPRTCMICRARTGEGMGSVNLMDSRQSSSGESVGSKQAILPEDFQQDLF